MGLFALRKADASSASLSRGEASASGPSDRSVAQLIRARFNGRKKRQANLSQSSVTTDATSVDASIHPSSKRLVPKYTSLPSDSEVDQTARRSNQFPSNRTSSDVVTVTLAHKLNELATAHKEGLLNDDDYRVLRQNLFNSFATHSSPPVETPVVKSVEPVSLRFSSTSRDDCSTINSACPPSLHTQNTNRSSVSTLFNRLRRRPSKVQSTDEQDRLSVLSSTPGIPLSPAIDTDVRTLGRHASTDSLRTTRSRQIPPDLRSVSSKRSLRSTVTISDAGGISRGSTRSLSLRTKEPPPSSFNTKFLTSRLSSLDSNGDRLRSAADIRAAIRAVEAEQQSVITSLSLLSQPQSCSTPYGLGQPGTGIATCLGPSLDSSHGYERSVPDSYALSGESFWTKQGGGEDVNELERRRAEISLRYQQRLDYLKARLKGAEIHERILRK